MIFDTITYEDFPLGSVIFHDTIIMYRYDVIAQVNKAFDLHVTGQNEVIF